MSSQIGPAPAALRRAAGWTAAARDGLLAVRPLYVLSTLLAVQWAALAALAVTIRHNGWVYYMGGDQLWHYTGAWLLAHRAIAPAFVGVGWTTLLAPVARFAGPDLVSALPAIILFNAIVLVPLALVCVYGIAERIGGRLFGYWAAVLWIALPYAAIPYALAGYHQKYTELTLPQVLGLGAMSDFPSVVALLVGAYLCLRAVDGGHWLWPAGGGFAVAYALAVKPSNAVFLVAPAVLFLGFRRRAAVPFVAGLVPPLAVLGLWKVRGFGHVPAFARSAPGQRVALGAGDFVKPLQKYTKNDSWTQLHNNLLQLREHLWSDRVLEFLAIAGIVALLIRSRRAGLFVGAWFVTFLLLKGTYVNARVDDGGFWRLLLPAFPAFVLLVAAVPLLLPGVRLRPVAPRPLRIPRRALVGGLAGILTLLVLFPLALIAAAKPVRRPNVSALQVNSTLVPVSAGIDLRATQRPGGVLLTWRADRPSPGKVFYRVFRTQGAGGAVCVVVVGAADECRAQTGDTVCRLVPRAPDSCLLSAAATPVGTARRGAWLDRPGRGTWTYRIGLSANWLNDPQFGDAYVFSRATTITVP